LKIYSFLYFHPIIIDLLQSILLNELHRVKILCDLAIYLEFGADDHVWLSAKHNDHINNKPVCLVSTLMEVIRILIQHNFDNVTKQDTVKEYLDVVQK